MSGDPRAPVYMFVGGEGWAFERVRLLLGLLADPRHLTHGGSSGARQILKGVNQLRLSLEGEMPLMLTIFQATAVHGSTVRDLFHEYLLWVCPVIEREYAAVFDPGAVLEHHMEDLDIFMPPDGRLLLASDEDGVAACACVRTIGPGMAEIKRMYVRPAFRRRGIGRALLDAAIAEMRTAGYTTMRLDSARFMTDAHALYRAAGFGDVAPYPESEISQEYHAHWVFMELSLGSRDA